jgi:hypothetical protein
LFLLFRFLWAGFGRPFSLKLFRHGLQQKNPWVDGNFSLCLLIVKLYIYGILIFKTCKNVINFLKQNQTNAKENFTHIVFSALNHVKDISSRVRAIDYIEKPFSIQDLKDKIQKHIK